MKSKYVDIIAIVIMQTNAPTLSEKELLEDNLKSLNRVAGAQSIPLCLSLPYIAGFDSGIDSNIDSLKERENAWGILENLLGDAVDLLVDLLSGYKNKY